MLVLRAAVVGAAAISCGFQEAETPPPTETSEAETSEFDAAYDTHVEEIGRHSDRLLEAFDAEEKLVRAGRIKGGARLTVEAAAGLLRTIREEREAFEEEGLIPLSAPMREHAGKFLAGRAASETRLRKVAERHLRRAIRDDPEAAREIQNRIEIFTMPRAVAVLNVSVGSRSDEEIPLWSDGTAGPDRDLRWACRRGVLSLSGQEPGTTAGYRLDRMRLSLDGRSMSGLDEKGKVKSATRVR